MANNKPFILDHISPYTFWHGFYFVFLLLGPESSLRGLIYGVSVIQVSATRRELIFGCYSGKDYAKVGGIGKITGTDSEWSNRDVSRLVSKGTIRAGAIFNVPDLSQSCSFEPRPQLCLLQGTEPTPEPTPIPTKKPYKKPNGDGGQDTGSGVKPPQKLEPATAGVSRRTCNESVIATVLFIIFLSSRNEMVG